MPKKSRKVFSGRTPEGNWLSAIGDKFTGLKRSVDRLTLPFTGIPFTMYRKFYDSKSRSWQIYKSPGRILVGLDGGIVNSNGQVVVERYSLSTQEYKRESYSLEKFCELIQEETVRIESNYLSIVNEQINLATLQQEEARQREQDAERLNAIREEIRPSVEDFAETGGIFAETGRKIKFVDTLNGPVAVFTTKGPYRYGILTRLLSVFRSEKGHKQEDRVVVGSRKIGGWPITFMGVIDGMGGHTGGEQAAQFFAEALREAFNTYNPNSDQEYPTEMMKQVVQVAEAEAVNRLRREKLPDAGCVYSLGFVIDNKGEKTLYIIYRGDAPVVAFSSQSEEGNFAISPHEAMVRDSTGRITKRISNWLGPTMSSSIQPAYFVRQLRRGDVVAVMSDGIGNNVGLQELGQKNKLEVVSTFQAIALNPEIDRNGQEDLSRYPLAGRIIYRILNSLGMRKPTYRDNQSIAVYYYK